MLVIGGLAIRALLQRPLQITGLQGENYTFSVASEGDDGQVQAAGASSAENDALSVGVLV